MPHTLIFIDLPTPDPEASARFYEAVFGWEIKGRPAGTFHQIVPGGEFAGPDGQPSGVGNLHLGLFDSANPVPEPNTPPVHAGDRPSGPQARDPVRTDSPASAQTCGRCCCVPLPGSISRAWRSS